MYVYIYIYIRIYIYIYRSAPSEEGCPFNSDQIDNTGTSIFNNLFVDTGILFFIIILINMTMVIMVRFTIIIIIVISITVIITIVTIIIINVVIRIYKYIFWYWSLSLWPDWLGDVHLYLTPSWFRCQSRGGFSGPGNLFVCLYFFILGLGDMHGRASYTLKYLSTKKLICIYRTYRTYNFHFPPHLFSLPDYTCVNTRIQILIHMNINMHISFV
jgi:hypothetical protein